MGGDGTEQRLLVAKHRQLGQAVGAIGDGHGQMGEHDAGVVGVPGDAAVAHGHRHGPVSPERSAISASRAVPACDTRPSPSVVTFSCRTDWLRCTFKEPFFPGRYVRREHAFSQVRRAFSRLTTRQQGPDEQSRLARRSSS